MKPESDSGFVDLGHKPRPIAEVANPADDDKKYYPNMHFDGDVDLPDEGEAHIKFRKHELTTRKDKGGTHHSHNFEVTHIKPIKKSGESGGSSKSLSDALDAVESRKISKAQAKEINQEEMDEED